MVRLILLVGSALFLSSFVECRLSRLNDDEFHGELERGNSPRRFKRQMMSLGTKWANGHINYYFAGNNEDAKKTMRAGMDYIKNRTCIKFFENSQASQRIKIWVSPMAGCDAKVGAPGTNANGVGEDNLNFGNCPILGSAVHEITHTLGSFHEHNRPDRDSYLTVNMDEVKRTGQGRNMNIQPWGMISMLVPFDYGSCMMYDTHKYGQEIMIPKDMEYQRTMGNRRVTFYDIEKINKFYGCKCEKELPCFNGGYTSPGDCSRCVCPKGYFGRLCNERPCKDSYELEATNEWQFKDIFFNYTFTGDNYNYFHSTFAYINAPVNKTIEILLDELDNVTCMYGCNVNGVEIKTKEDIKLTSPIVCCLDHPIDPKKFISKNNPTIIEMYTRSDKESHVGFRYRFV